MPRQPAIVAGMVAVSVLPSPVAISAMLPLCKAMPPSKRPMTPTTTPATGSMLLFSREIVSMFEKVKAQVKSIQRTTQEEIMRLATLPSSSTELAE